MFWLAKYLNSAGAYELVEKISPLLQEAAVTASGTELRVDGDGWCLNIGRLNKNAFRTWLAVFAEEKSAKKPAKKPKKAA